jgi:hypothetical protein
LGSRLYVCLLCDDKKQLELDDVENFDSQTEEYMQLVGTLMCVISLWLPSIFIVFPAMFFWTISTINESGFL